MIKTQILKDTKYHTITGENGTIYVLLDDVDILVVSEEPEPNEVIIAQNSPTPHDYNPKLDPFGFPNDTEPDWECCDACE